MKKKLKVFKIFVIKFKIFVIKAKTIKKIIESTNFVNEINFQFFPRIKIELQNCAFERKNEQLEMVCEEFKRYHEFA